MVSERRWYRWGLWVPILGALLVSGCVQPHAPSSSPSANPRVIAIAPVLNLSGSRDIDPLKVTDLVASEFLSFRGVTVIPVNLVLAELERQSRHTVQSSEDAIALAQALGADATVVVAITEFDPYTPVVGMVMQWYAARPERTAARLDPVSASREAQAPAAGLSAPDPTAPRWQVQRVLNGTDERVCHEIKDYADQHEGQKSPYGWRKYLRSQELYVRFSSWAMIRTMLLLDHAGTEPHEAQS
jgi:hypothetical protein